MGLIQEQNLGLASTTRGSCRPLAKRAVNRRFGPYRGLRFLDREIEAFPMGLALRHYHRVGPWSGSSRLHLPASLRSPGITRLLRYYGRSDSCPAAFRILIRDTDLRLEPGRSPCVLSPNLPIIPSPTTSCCPGVFLGFLAPGLPDHVAMVTCFQASASFGLRH